MKRQFSRAIALAASTALAACAGGEIEGAGEAPLSKNANAPAGAAARAPADVAVRDYLRAQGLGRDAADALRTLRANRSRDGALTHVLLEQQAGGLRVEGAYVKATVNGAGQVAHVIDRAARFTRAAANPAGIDEAQALRATMAAVHPGVAVDAVAVDRNGNTTAFGKGNFFYREPTVERIALPAADGSLDEAFLVQTWTAKGNLLHETLVSGGGAVLDVALRTNSDSYNVFVEDPLKGAQTVVSPPAGVKPWLGSGSQTTHNIAGNNVHAYLDNNPADNAPDPGGQPVTDGNFGTAWDGGVAPTTDANQAVAVQNLFYFNNHMHDTLYANGFDEAAGNFQEDNFGLGGRGSDSVNAEAQDGSGTDNANFATPRDGQNPRMQMYLWTGRPSHQVVVNAPAGLDPLAAAGAQFGAQLDQTGLTDDVALAEDATGATSLACGTVGTSVSGKIAIVDRGTCSFVIKAKNVQTAGAVGMIVVNNQGDTLLAMGGTDSTVTIPSVFVGQTDGNHLKTLQGLNATIRATNPTPLQRDGDIDADIVFHEYGHGLTWRMIGRMSGPVAGAIGEGMSDVLAIILNDDPIVGEYAFSDPRGIRSAPYDTDPFPKSYGTLTWQEVHDDGELYGAIGWSLYLEYGRQADPLLGYLVDGMNFTPAQPMFEDMRDGILKAVPATDSCKVWRAFAKHGVGVGAKASVRGSKVVVTQSFAVPPGC